MTVIRAFRSFVNASSKLLIYKEFCIIFELWTELHYTCANSSTIWCVVVRKVFLSHMVQPTWIIPRNTSFYFKGNNVELLTSLPGTPFWCHVTAARTWAKFTVRCHFQNLVYIKKLCGFDLFPSVCWHLANRQCGETSSKQSVNSKFKNALAHAKNWDIATNKNLAKVMKLDNLTNLNDVHSSRETLYLRIYVILSPRT